MGELNRLISNMNSFRINWRGRTEGRRDTLATIAWHLSEIRCPPSTAL